MTPELLIIGYGNSLRSDDGIGPVIADKLRSSLSDLHPHVVTVQQLNPELAEECAKSTLVVFIDVCDRGIAGEVSLVWLDGSSERTSPLNHFVDARRLLAWCEECYDKRPAAALVTITGASFAYSTELSPGLTAALPATLSKIEDLVRAWVRSAHKLCVANSD